MSKRSNYPQKPAAPAQAPAPAAKPNSMRWARVWGQMLDAMAADGASGYAPRRAFAAPVLPPGVVPKGARNALAMDSAQAGYGWLNNGAGFCGLGFPGYTYLAELFQRSEYRAPTATIAKELTREWIRFEGAEDSKQKELEKAFEDFNIQACFRDCALHDGAFGRGQLYINVKGQESDQRRKLPLVVDDGGATLKKGQLLGFKPIEPIWTTPWMYNSIDPTKPDFYKPDWWYVLGKQTHSSRLLTFVSRPVPDILKPSYNFSGMSLSQLVEPYVGRWLKGVDGVSRLITNYSTSGIATDMQALLEEGVATDINKRAQLFNQMRDNRGLLLLDKASEEFFQFNVPLSGLAELVAQLQEHMAAPTHIPLVKLTGITPAGLNANSEGEIKVFYDFIASEQEDLFRGHLNTVLRLVQLHLWGKVDPEIKAEFVPLDTPTDKEVSEMTASKAKAGSDYINAGVISPDEERDRLRNDPNSGYTFIKGSAPPPPLEAQAEVDEEGKQADHARGEESAEASAQREADAREHAAEIERKNPKPTKGK